MQSIDIAMIALLISAVCFTTLAYRIGRAHGYTARREEERREREAPTLEQIRERVAASARQGY